MKHVGLFNPESVRRGVLGTTEASQICPSKRQSKKSSADFALGQLPANHPKKDFAEKSEEGELPTPPWPPTEEKKILKQKIQIGLH